MSTNNFYIDSERPELGDVVQCCDDGSHMELKRGEHHLVREITVDGQLKLTNISASCFASRFRLIRRKETKAHVTDPAQMFWMVLGLGTPIYRHTSKLSAKNEAERLARLNPGEEFVVLEAVAAVRKSDVAWYPYAQSIDDAATEVPF